MKKILKTLMISSLVLTMPSVLEASQDYRDFRVIMQKSKSEKNTYYATPLLVARVKLTFFTTDDSRFCSKFDILNRDDLIPRYVRNYDKNFVFNINIGFKYFFENSANIYTLNKTEFCEEVNDDDLRNISRMIENNEFFLTAFITNKTGGKNLKVEFLPFVPKDVEYLTEYMK